MAKRRKNAKPREQNSYAPDTTLERVIGIIKGLGGSAEGFQDWANSKGCCFGMQTIRLYFACKKTLTNPLYLSLYLYIEYLDAQAKR